MFATSIMLQSGPEGRGSYGLFVDTAYRPARQWAVSTASNVHPIPRPGYSCGFMFSSSSALRLPECPVPLPRLTSRVEYFDGFEGVSSLFAKDSFGVRRPQ